MIQIYLISLEFGRGRQLNCVRGSMAFGLRGHSRADFPHGRCRASGIPAPWYCTSGEIISRFEKKGLKLVALKMYRFTKEKCAEHYSHLVGKSFYPIIEKSMMAAPGTVRGDLCMSHQENIIHASDSLEGDYFEYDTPLFDYLYASDEV